MPKNEVRRLGTLGLSWPSHSVPEWALVNDLGPECAFDENLERTSLMCCDPSISYEN
jgi:hypothetical protein